MALCTDCVALDSFDLGLSFLVYKTGIISNLWVSLEDYPRKLVYKVY